MRVIQKKLHHHAISVTIDFWDLIMKTKVVQNQITAEKIIFVIGCMSHPEIATLSGHLGNFRFLTPDYEDKIV